MSILPSTWTVGDTIASARKIAKAQSAKDVSWQEASKFYASSLHEVVNQLNLATDPSYYTNEVIAMTSGIEQAKFYSTTVSNPHLSGSANDGIISAVDAINKTISRTSGSFSKGSLGILTQFAAADPSFARGVWMLYIGVIRFVTSGTIAQYEVISDVFGTAIYDDPGTITPQPYGEDPTYAEVSTSLALLSSLTENQFDLTGLQYTLDKIISIHDSEWGHCHPVNANEFFSISGEDITHTSYNDNIIWTRIGNVLYFKHGENTTTAGVKTIYYQRSPQMPSYFDETEYVDLPDKYIPLLISRMVTYMMFSTSQAPPISQATQSDATQVSVASTSEMVDRKKQ